MRLLELRPYGAPGERVPWDQVDLARRIFQQRRQLMGVLGAVVDVIQHHVLDGHPALVGVGLRKYSRAPS